MKTILVTGAATGIGLAVSRALSAEDFTVLAAILPGQDREELQKLNRVHMIEANLSKEEDITQLIASVKAHKRLDGMISNAGIAIPGPLELVPVSQIRLQYQVNTFAPVQIIQGLLPELRANKGRVVLIGAGQARVSLPCGGTYGSSKAALSALMDSLRAEVSPYGIQISVIEPGAIKTGILKSSEEKWAALLSSVSKDIAPDVAERYRNGMEKTFAASARAFETAIQPEAFAKIVLSVLNCKNPKPRYLIGREAKALGFLARLPDRVRAGLMEKLV